MTQDEKTIAFYDKEASTYAKNPSEIGESERFLNFANRLIAGGDVLDLGCGAGNAARKFHAMGFNVTAFDGSEGMLTEIRKVSGINTVCAGFEDLHIVGGFDGIWANFCLQHVPRNEFPSVLDRVTRALRANGWLFIGIHEGTETRRDNLGRLYCHHTEADLNAALLERGVVVRYVTRADSVGYDGTPFTGMTLVAQKNG